MKFMSLNLHEVAIVLFKHQLNANEIPRSLLHGSHGSLVDCMHVAWGSSPHCIYSYVWVSYVFIHPCVYNSVFYNG